MTPAGFGVLALVQAAVSGGVANGPGSADWTTALLAFAAAGLAVLALALLWEATRRWRHRRAMHRELDRLQRKEPEARRGDALLRERQSDGLAWLEPVLQHLPQWRDLKHVLEQARVPWSAGTFAVVSLGLASTVGLTATMLGAGGPVALAAAAAGGALPWLWVRRKRSKRFAAFEEMFPDAIEMLGRSIRAGHAFSTALQVVAEESEPPVAEEFRQAFEEQKFGLPLRDSLLGLADRVSLPDVRIFVTAVLIQRESGGNLAESLDNLAYIIRERFRLRREIRVHTAQGRMTGYVLAAAPIVAGVGMFLVNPEYMQVMFVEPAGRAMLAAAGLLQLFGFLVIRHIVRVDF